MASACEGEERGGKSAVSHRASMREDRCIGCTHRGDATRIPHGAKLHANPRCFTSGKPVPPGTSHLARTHPRGTTRAVEPPTPAARSSARRWRGPDSFRTRIRTGPRAKNGIRDRSSGSGPPAPATRLPDLDVEISGTSRGAIDGPSQRRVRVGFESTSLIRTSTASDTHSHRLPFDDAIRAPPGNRESRLPPDTLRTIWDCR
jgi:hypothetical protein